MRRTIFSLLLLFSLPKAQVWSGGTAVTIPAGRWEIGVFQPLKYGQTEELEWSVHPISFLIIPNVQVKKYWGRSDFGMVSTRHSLVYPTPLLRKLRLKGFGNSTLADMDVGGIISGDPDISEIPVAFFSSRNEVLITRHLGNGMQLTGKFGMALAIASGDWDKRTTVDLPLVYPRIAVLYNGYGLNVGADLIRALTKRLQYLLDVDVQLLPGSESDFFLEHKSLFLWSGNDRIRISLGYKIVYGHYPFGIQWHLFPLFDVQWGW